MVNSTEVQQQEDATREALNYGTGSGSDRTQETHLSVSVATRSVLYSCYFLHFQSEFTNDKWEMTNGKCFRGLITLGHEEIS